MQIIIKTQLHPTEDRLKVGKCLFNITGRAEMEEEMTEEGNFFVIRTPEFQILEEIREKLRRQRILDSARKVFMQSIKEDSLTFYLNKQAAYTGRIHFVKDPGKEDVLGPIIIMINADSKKLQEIVDWLTS
ncbi:MAG: RNA-binding domain-containing protein [Candidatus Helarchaeota archaeon]